MQSRHGRLKTCSEHVRFAQCKLREPSPHITAKPLLRFAAPSQRSRGLRPANCAGQVTSTAAAGNQSAKADLQCGEAVSTAVSSAVKYKEAQQREMLRLQTERDIKQCEQSVGAQVALRMLPPLIADTQRSADKKNLHCLRQASRR